MAKQLKVTPKGVFHWAHIGTPDTTFKAEGQYHIRVQLSGKEAETMRESVDMAHKSWKDEVIKTKGKKSYQEFLPYKVILGEDGLEEGIQFHFKMKASGVNSRTGQAFTQRPMVVGPDKTPLPTNIKLANGSLGKVAYEIAPYQFGSGLGIQLRMKSVQVLKLIEWNGSGGSDVDVFSVEKGYEVKVDTKPDVKEEVEEIFPDDDNNGDF